MSDERRPGRRASRRRVRGLALRVVPALRRLDADRDALRRRVAASDDERRRLSTELDRVRGELAELATQRAVSGVGARDDLDYLFIVTYGRSGSTLLQGILDSVPGYLIRGENRNVLYRLYQYHDALVRVKAEWSKGDPLEPKDAWFGIDGYESEAAVAGLRALVVSTLFRPRPDTRVTGFKEIRWWHDDWQRYLDFLQTVFPGARFVFNVRDHEAVSRSKWWARNPNALARLDEYEARLDAMAEHLGERAYRVNFDEFVADPGVLAGLFEWLGEPFDRDRVEATMAVKHSS